VLVGATALVTSEVVSQDEGSAEAGSGDEKESLVETWVQHAMPGPHHPLLGKMVGTWDLTVKYRMDSGAEVVESRGSCQRKWILGKRFVLEEFDGGSLALPFQGMAIYGYDAFEQKYTSVWVDTTSTAMTASRGTCQDDCKVIAFTGQHGDPWTGTKRPSRGVTRLINDNEHVLELYEPGSNGQEFRVLEIRYTRKTSPEAKGEGKS
jgi:hypothetical protein